jgi:peptidyl-prolyl cis-trans isomerase SurA
MLRACQCLGLFSIALLSLLSAAPVFAKTDDPVVDKIAAVVGDQIILLSEVMEQAAPMIRELEQAGQGAGAELLESKMQRQIKEILDGMIDDAIFEREAREMKITVTQDEIDRAVENMARENNIDMPTFKQAIEAQGMDYLTYRSRLRSQLMKFKILNLRVRSRVKISDTEARQHYNDQVRDIRATGTYEGAHILIRAPLRASAKEAADAKRRAEDILARLEKGADFAEMAKAESEDAATAPGGGSLGARRPGSIPRVLERAFFDLEVGEIGGPIRTPAGFHIIRLNEREDLGVMPFKEAREKIVQSLQEEEMQRQSDIWLKELRSRIFIDVRM